LFKPLTHLERLEAESIFIMREVLAECENPVMLYSIGKDSSVMLHLARKAFHPSKPPFPAAARRHHLEVPRDDRVPRQHGPGARHGPDRAHQSGRRRAGHRPVQPRLPGAHRRDEDPGAEAGARPVRFDAAFGGARRDEEKSRAKERVFSFRNAQHRWDPKNQRPELWRLYNGRVRKGESIRVFPLSNWTELDIWQYIYQENLPIVPLYFAKERPVVERDGMLIMVDDDRCRSQPGETPQMRKVRFRTLGCYPLTGAIESDAGDLPSIIEEMLVARTSERQGRAIDHDASASMEKKKQEGYF
jgi:sulfate adenylyltransferase subunit 2